MKRIVLALGITALVLPLMGTLEPAEARVSWNAGADFSVGGVYFSLGFSDFDRYSQAPRYYYRTPRAFSYRGYECGSACYIDDGYYYHDRGCPLVGYHFSRNHYDPVHVWGAIGIHGYRSHGRYYGPYAHGYRYDSRRHSHRSYYPRQDWRHDKRYDRRHDRRYDRRDGHRRYDSNADSDSDRRGGRYDRQGRQDRGHRGEGRIERNDERRDRRGAERSRSRRRDRD